MRASCRKPVVAVIVLLAMSQIPSQAVCQPAADARGHATLWATADSLMPAWGFYPLGQSYGGTKPLGQFAAWCAAGNNGQLTWVAEFPLDDDYQVWVRQYGGYGKVEVLVDERLVSGGAGGPGGGRYVWRHAGHIVVKKGRHHVDLAVSRGMFDTVLFTTNGNLTPANIELPNPVEKPTLRALRTFRDDAHLSRQAGERGFVVGRATAYEEALYDWLPDKSGQDKLDCLRLWGSAGQYVNGTFAIRAVKDLDELTVSLGQLTGPGNTTINSSGIDVRVIHVRDRKNSLFRPSRVRLLIPELLLRDDRTELPPKGEQGGYGGGRCVTRIPARQSRQFWVTVNVPGGSPTGMYRGEILISGSSSLRLSVELESLPIKLQPAEGYYAIYHPSQPNNPDRPHYVSSDRYLAELQDHVRHGLNAATLYGGFSTLDLARRAGISRAPCLMHWPGGDAKEQVTAAKRIGFEDLYYYGVDEPNNPEQIERCRKEAERRQRAGLHMLTAINSKTAQVATRDFIDRPVYNIYVFGNKNNADVMYVRERGFLPISYWVTATTYPLPYRALTGFGSDTMQASSGKNEAIPPVESAKL